MDCFSFCGYDNVPGNQFNNSAYDFRKLQKFDWVNGYAVPTECQRGPASSVKDCLIGSCTYDPRETYGERINKPLPPFVPKFAKYERQVLKFIAYYREAARNSQWDELYRVRPVEIFYFLSDDTITIYEPQIQNSGLVHGTLVKRHKIRKNDLGEIWNWKELNIGCNIIFYERVYRIVDANDWTKSFYQTEGLILNPPEEMPSDPYITKRYSNPMDQPSQSLNDIDDSEFFKPKINLREEDVRVTLTYNCVWNEGNEDSLEYKPLPLEHRKFDIHYRMWDGKVDVEQVLVPNSGQEPYALLLKETKLPKNYRDIPPDYPTIFMAPTEKEIIEYYTHEDFQIGATINVYGRKFLIYDMDESTKQFYREYYGHSEIQSICLPPPEVPYKDKPRKIMIPPWNGWGSAEDSLRNCLTVRPQAPVYVANQKMLEYGLKSLKYGAVIDSTRPEDEGRQFTIWYRIMNDKVAVYEIPVRNSGWPGGKFLDFTYLQKPGSSNDKPVYYRPHDFYIGASIDVFGTRFMITCADGFVEEYMDANPELYPEEVMCNLKEYFQCQRDNAACFQSQCATNPPEPQGKQDDLDNDDCDSFFAHLGFGTQKSTCTEENFDNFRGCGYD